MVWEGRGVIAGGRRLVGATNPDEAQSGSVRGDLAVDIGRNSTYFLLWLSLRDSQTFFFQLFTAVTALTRLKRRLRCGSTTRKSRVMKATATNGSTKSRAQTSHLTAVIHRLL